MKRACAAALARRADPLRHGVPRHAVVTAWAYRQARRYYGLMPVRADTAPSPAPEN